MNQHPYLVGKENLLKERGAVNAPPDVKEKAKNPNQKARRSCIWSKTVDRSL